MSGCERCGDCCREVCWPISELSADWALLHGLDLIIDQGTLMACARIPCRKFDPLSKRCVDYSRRPLTCRLYLCDRAKT